MNKSSKKKKEKIFKKGLGTRGIRLVLLRFLSKNIQNFQFLEKNSRFPNFSKKKIINQNFQLHEKIQDFKIFQKKKEKKISKFSIPSKNSSSPNSKKKKKKKHTHIHTQKKSSLNSSSGTESYNHLPYFSMVQYQVNCPPSVFFEAWSMSQSRGIRQVCRILFNE